MKGYHLRLIRHGKTDANTSARYIGSTDEPLSPLGKSELFDKLDEFDYDSVQKIYSSPLKRCIQTAEILYPNRLIEVVPDLREMDFGDFEDKSADELVENPDFKAWIKGGLDTAPPNGENGREVIARSFLALDYIIKDMMENGLTNCAVVTHGGIIMNAVSCFGVPKYKALDLACDFGEGYEIMATAQMWQQSEAFELLGRFPLNFENNNYTEDF